MKLQMEGKFKISECLHDQQLILISRIILLISPNKNVLFLAFNETENEMIHPKRWEVNLNQINDDQRFAALGSQLLPNKQSREMTLRSGGRRALINWYKENPN